MNGDYIFQRIDWSVGSSLAHAAFSSNKTYPVWSSAWVTMVAYPQKEVSYICNLEHPKGKLKFMVQASTLFAEGF